MANYAVAYTFPTEVFIKGKSYINRCIEIIGRFSKLEKRELIRYTKQLSDDSFKIQLNPVSRRTENGIEALFEAELANNLN